MPRWLWLAALVALFLSGCAERELPQCEPRVVLSSPEDGDVLNEARVYLDWERFTGANGYRILLWRAENPDSIVLDRIEFDSSTKTTCVLTNGIYAWTVGVRVGEGEFGAWSDTFYFEIKQEPFRIASWAETPGTSKDVAAADGYLYVADGGAGISVVNCLDPAGLFLVGNIDWAEQYDARGIFADSRSGILAVADYRGTPPLVFFDISDRASPAMMSTAGVWARLCGDAFGLWMRDTLFIIAADRDNGMFVYDMATPGIATQRGDPYMPPGFCCGVCAQGTLAAAAAEDAGVVLVDISNPDEKIPLGTCDTPGQATRLRFFGEYLFVADGLAGLAVIDVSDPTSPTLLYQSDTQVGDAQDIEIATFGGRDYIALAIGSDGILIYDVTTPSAPALIQRIETMYAYGVGADENAFYIADRDWGVVAVVKD